MNVLFSQKQVIVKPFLCPLLHQVDIHLGDGDSNFKNMLPEYKGKLFCLNLWYSFYSPLAYLLMFSRVKSCPTLCNPMDCTACQPSLSSSISRNVINLMSIESVMPSSHLILCHPLLFLPSIFPSIRVFSMCRLFTSGAKVLELQLQWIWSWIFIFQWIFRTDFF